MPPEYRFAGTPASSAAPRRRASRRNTLGSRQAGSSASETRTAFAIFRRPTRPRWGSDGAVETIRHAPYGLTAPGSAARASFWATAELFESTYHAQETRADRSSPTVRQFRLKTVRRTALAILCNWVGTLTDLRHARRPLQSIYFRVFPESGRFIPEREWPIKDTGPRPNQGIERLAPNLPDDAGSDDPIYEVVETVANEPVARGLTLSAAYALRDSR